MYLMMKNIYTYILFLLAISLSLIILSIFIPKFKDSDKAEELSKLWSDNQLTEKEYIHRYEALMTDKYKVFNIGTGLLTLSLTGLLIIIIKKYKTFSDFFSVPSIDERWKYFLLNNFGILFLVLGIVEAIYREDIQVPIYDNAAQAIFSLVFLAPFLFILSNIILKILLMKERIQSTLLHKTWFIKGNIIFDILFSVGLMIFAALLFLFITDGSVLGVLSVIILTCITLSLKSEITAYKIQSSTKL
jgi:hypothetical protein